MFSSLRNGWPYPILAILFMPFGCIAPKHFYINLTIRFWAYLMKVVPDKRRVVRTNFDI
jgi:hypothetical protein